MVHKASAYLGFSSMKRLGVGVLGVVLLPPGWGASPSQGYTQALNSHGTRVDRGTVRVVSCPRTQQCRRQRLEPGALAPESSALTTRHRASHITTSKIAQGRIIQLPEELGIKSNNTCSKLHTCNLISKVHNLYSKTA